MEHRKGKEFTPKTKDFLLRRSKGRDEITGEPLREDFEIHHRLPLSFARDHYPHLDPNLLKSPENARVVNKDTHLLLHRETDEKTLHSIAQALLNLQRGLF